ncbi:MAG: endonuclease domain-containing protein [Gammaproteobacteria bacterium]
MTETERRLWQHLRERQLGGYKFRRQHPLGRYVLDLVCLEARLVIEADGGQHGERVEDDRLRTEWLEARGFRVVRFWNHDVLNHPEEVKAVIWRALSLGVQPPSPPSPCQGEERKMRGYLSRLSSPDQAAMFRREG